MNDDKENLLRACANMRDQQFAQFLVFAIGIAAEKHPEDLRVMLGRVFDVSGIEDCTNRCMAVLTQVQESVNESRHSIADLRREMEAIEKRMGAIDVALYRAECKVGIAG